MYNYDIIQFGLDTKYVGQTFVQFENLKSTHQKAKNISSNCPDGMLVLTENQESFKIRNNKIWYPVDGDNLFMSLIFKAKEGNDYSSEIVQIANAAVVSCLKELDSNMNVSIKWPNDIMINNKKICSTFCECIGKKDNSSLILSIYININRNAIIENSNSGTEAANNTIISDNTNIKEANSDINNTSNASENVESIESTESIESIGQIEDSETTEVQLIQDNIVALREIYSFDFTKETLISNILNKIEIYYDELLNKSTINKALEVFRVNNSVINKFVGAKKINKKTVNVFFVEGINNKGQLMVLNNKKEALLLNRNEDIIEWCTDDKKA